MRHTNINQLLEKALPERNKVFRLSNEQIEKITQVSGVVLAILAGTGIILLSTVAPNIFGAINSLAKGLKGRKSWSKNEQKAKVRRAFYYLKRSGMIRLTGTGNEMKVVISSKGRKKLDEINFQNMTVPKQANWDGKWWLVAADIPTKDYRWAADLFRRKLKDMHFYTLQRTMWFYPYNPQVEIQFIAEQFGIAKYVTVMRIDKLDKEDQKNLKVHFAKLKLI